MCLNGYNLKSIRVLSNIENYFTKRIQLILPDAGYRFLFQPFQSSYKKINFFQSPQTLILADNVLLY